MHWRLLPSQEPQQYLGLCGHSRRDMSQGKGVKVGTCDACNRREVVAEVKRHTGQEVQFCLPVLAEAVRRGRRKMPKDS